MVTKTDLPSSTYLLIYLPTCVTEVTVVTVVTIVSVVTVVTTNFYTKTYFTKKNPAYGRHQLAQPMRIVEPIEI